MSSTIEVIWTEVRRRKDESLDETLLHRTAVPFNMCAKVTMTGEIRIIEQEKFEITWQPADATEIRRQIIEDARELVRERGIDKALSFALTPREFVLLDGYVSRVIGFATVAALRPLEQRKAA